MPRPSSSALLLTTVLALAICPTAPAAAAGAPVLPEPALSALLRTAIVTADVKASKRFYVDGLGFRLRFEGDITRPAVIRQLGLAQGQTAWFVVLEGADSLAGRTVTGGMIGLLRIDRPPLRPLRRPAGAALAVGEALLAVQTAQFDAIAGRLRAQGVAFVVEPMPAADGSEIEMVVRDPSGTRVHIVERRARP